MSARNKKPRSITLTIAKAAPVFYESANPEEISDALEIGAHMFQTVKHMRATEEIKEIEERNALEIAKIKTTAEQHIKGLEDQIVKSEEEHMELRKEHQQRIKQMFETQHSQEQSARQEGQEQAQRAFEQRLQQMEKELEAIREKNHALNERKAILEAGRDQDIRIAEERTKALLQHALDEKERAILRSERTLAGLQESYQKQAEELRQLADIIRKKPQQNVKTKGSEYEVIFREKLIAAYGLGEKFSLIDSAHNGIGHAGDYLMTWANHTILWEVKNYDRPVPSAEVDKFKRDMKENHNVRIGVMVSRYTPITGKVSKGDRDIEFVEGKMLIYLSNFEAMTEEALPSLMLLFRLWWESEKNTEEEETKEATIRSIERLHAAAVKSKVEWRLHKSRMEEAIRWFAEVVEENEQKLQHALNILHGSTILAIPEGIFRSCDGDEKAQQLIQLILEHTRPSLEDDATPSLVLNDLAEIVGKAKGLSRDTAKTHIRAVLLDSAIEQAKGKSPARVLGLTLKGSEVVCAV